MTQQQALDVMMLGHNVFLTGEPGAGKTHTLNQFIEHCDLHDIGVGVTASTGIAATHIGGMTIHSWSGIGIKDYVDEEDLDRLSKKAQLRSRFKKTRVLIIDEVSMLDGARLDAINDICKRLKNSDKPYGGLQVILCGDLFQLPPVNRNSSELDFPHRSQAWQDLNLKICYLSEQHRTEDDTLLSLLRAIRTNDDIESIAETLAPRIGEFTEEDTTRLFTHNRNVDELNEHKLSLLDSEVKTFTMTSDGPERHVESLKKSCLAPEKLALKVGAQIICTSNSPAQGYYNGSRGEVIEFDFGKPVVKLQNGKVITMERAQWKIDDGDKTLASVSQYPLRLAWAITVHKSQGMSLDEAEIDLSKAFTPGMGYVALSRVRNLDGLYLRGLNNTALTVSPEISEFDKVLKQKSDAVIDSLSGITAEQLKDMHKSIRSNLAQDYAEYDKKLFEQLRQWRAEQAKSESVPAYMVLSDKTLIALAAEKPKKYSQLNKIHGLGEVKIGKYGSEIQKLVNQASGKLF